MNSDVNNRQLQTATDYRQQQTTTDYNRLQGTNGNMEAVLLGAYKQI